MRTWRTSLSVIIAAVDVGAIAVERLLDGVGLGRDLLEELGIDLFFQIEQVKHVDLPGQRGLGELGRLDRLEPVEAGMVGQRGIEAVLRVFLGLEILIAAGNIGVPPGECGRALQGTNRPLVLLDKRPGRASASCPSVIASVAMDMLVEEPGEKNQNQADDVPSAGP